MDPENAKKQTNTPRSEDYSTQRLSQRYQFDDPNMDLFFLGSLGWGAAGGLSVGEAFYVAKQITDGDVDSWVAAFERQGIVLSAQAETWQQRGLKRAAGEARIKAFACYRLAWQFAGPGETFGALFRNHQRLFDQAVVDLGFSVTAFTVSYKSGNLPGHFFKASDSSAPTLLVIGGADTCHEDRFFSPGRYFIERGYSVALVDLPGQGIVQEQGLYWEIETEKPIAAVVDELIARFQVDTRKLALLGMSLGGYFACRAAAHEPRLGAVIATTPLYRPGELFTTSAKQYAKMDKAKISAAAMRNAETLMWKAGASSQENMLELWGPTGVDPSLVTVPFLSVVGTQEGSVWKQQANDWHGGIQSTRKSLVLLDAETGADVHCQGSNPLRLVQEIDAWLKDVWSQQ